MLDALRNALPPGCARVTARARGLVETHRGTGVLLADGGMLSADRVIVAAGARSAEILPEYRHLLIAERGYHIEWDHGLPGGGLPVGGLPEETPDAPPTVFADHAIIASRMGRRMRASAFVEFGAWDAPPDDTKWEALERFALGTGLPVASRFSRWVGSRPTLPDYLPAIGAVPHRPGVLAAFGHQHLGLTLAAVTAALVAPLALGQEADGDLSPFDSGRFG